MGSSVRHVTLLRESAFATGLIACLLCPVASAQSAFSDAAPIAEPARIEVAPLKVGEKELEKYDIDKIGQRGIGKGFNLYSLRRERQLGQQLAASFDHGTRIINDKLVNDYVTRLAQKIANNSDTEVALSIKVIDAGEIPRAYGLPGGFLYVDSSLILAADGEAELAGLLAHEIAHVAARHATRALSRQRLSGIFNSVAFITGPAGMAVGDASGVAGPLSVKKFSRDSEYEADLLGIEYLYAAGYDPEAFLTGLEKLNTIEIQTRQRKNAKLNKVPGYSWTNKLPFRGAIARSLANYPLTEDRISRLQSEISTFLPNRKEYILDTGEFQEVKARLLATGGPRLRHRTGDSDDNTGPVLRRRTQETTDLLPAPNLLIIDEQPGTIRTFASPLP